MLFHNHAFFFWTPVSIVEEAAVIPNGAKIFPANETATFINRPANLLNSDPKTPPDWIILEIWALKIIISVEILLLNVFLKFVFYLAVISNSWADQSVANHFHQIFSNLFLKLFLHYF